MRHTSFPAINRDPPKLRDTLSGRVQQDPEVKEGAAMKIQQLLKQAQEFQKKMKKMQEELEQMTVEASAGGGMVAVTANGKQEILSITIEREVVNPDDIEMLQDLIIAAVNEAKRKAEALAQEEMKKITGGLGIPGMGGLNIPV
jgi:DNA-binding YbaB/EbfC family protein